MIKRISAMSAFAILAAVALMTCSPKNGSQPGADSTKAGGAGVSAERGKYLVTVGGCNDCHTPWKMGEKGPGPDMSKMLSGHPAQLKYEAPGNMQMPWMWAGDMTMTAFAGPWGISYSANLTPDSLTGVGSWTPDVFISAMRTGKHMGKGRQIMPPMPWEGMKQMTDDDLGSIFAYLRTIPAVSNQVPEPVASSMPPMGGGAPPPPPTGKGMPPGVPPPPAPEKHK